VGAGVPVSRPRRARVVVVEEFALVAEIFGLALDGVCDSRAVLVAGSSSTDSVAEDVVSRARPDAVFMDSDLGAHVDPAALVQDLARRGLAVVVLTNRASDEVARGEFLRRGATGALCKADGFGPVKVALNRALAHQPVTDPDEALRLMAAARNAKNAHVVRNRRLATLTPREREILRRLMAGRVVGEIARSSYVSEATVRTQIKSILAKLDVSCQIAAVAMAYRNGWSMAADEQISVAG
jgi:two-component system nitrate/nitrite response regulator NarL